MVVSSIAPAKMITIAASNFLFFFFPKLYMIILQAGAIDCKAARPKRSISDCGSDLRPRRDSFKLQLQKGILMFFILFFILIAVIAVCIRKSNNAQRQTEEDFWAREAEANTVRRKDIDGLPYITIPFEKFPTGISDDSEVIELEQKLKALDGRKILNLGNQTNTELKMQYGPANLNALTEYDQNYAALVSLLVSYSNALIRLGYESEAVPVLEFGVSCGTDNSKNFSLLAEFYKKNGMYAEIEALKEAAEKLDSLMKQPILEKLNQISERSA